MAARTLTERERRERQVFIDAAFERNPGAGRAVAIRDGEGTWREWRGDTGGGRQARPAASQTAMAEAVAQVVQAVSTARKAAKKANRRATAEAAATRMLQERARVAAQFSETAISTSLRESSNADLAAITAIAMSGTGQPAPAPRPVTEMTVDPQRLSLEDLGRAATAGRAGNSPFWGGAPAGSSPFWRGLQSGGASKGTSDA